MSRLDDELRLIYGRKEPSPDFADRVMERIARETTAPQAVASHSREPERWWQQLAEFFAVPKARWVAASVAASLVIAVLAVQYRKTPLAAPEAGGAVAAANGVVNPDAASGTSEKAVLTARPDRVPVRTRQVAPAKKTVRVSHRVIERQKPRPEDLALVAEGEAAKQRLMLALQIASSTLGEAQRIIHDDARGSEPVSNR